MQQSEQADQPMIKGKGRQGKDGRGRGKRNAATTIQYSVLMIGQSAVLGSSSRALLIVHA